MTRQEEDIVDKDKVYYLCSIFGPTVDNSWINHVRSSLFCETPQAARDIYFKGRSEYLYSLPAVYTYATLGRKILWLLKEEKNA